MWAELMSKPAKFSTTVSVPLTSMSWYAVSLMIGPEAWEVDLNLVSPVVDIQKKREFQSPVPLTFVGEFHTRGELSFLALSRGVGVYRGDWGSLQWVLHRCFASSWFEGGYLISIFTDRYNSLTRTRDHRCLANNGTRQEDSSSLHCAATEFYGDHRGDNELSGLTLGKSSHCFTSGL